MKTLLINTTCIVAASLAMGLSTTANAQAVQSLLAAPITLAPTTIVTTTPVAKPSAPAGGLKLSGEINLGWVGYETDEPGDMLYIPEYDQQTGSLDFAFDVMADAPEYGVKVFGYADMQALTDTTDFSDLQVMLESAAVGVTSAHGTLMGRIGARETMYAYASDLSVGGAGVATKFMDETYGAEAPFNSIEIIYAYAEGPLSFSAAWEPESGKISGAAGYDVRTVYGPARINGYVFEDEMKNAAHIDHINGYRVAGFIDNGALEVGANVSVEDISYTGMTSDLDRVSIGVGAKLSAHSNLDISVDYEVSEYSLGALKEESTSFSVGAEMGIGSAMDLGAYFKTYEDRPMFPNGAFTGTPSSLKSGTEMGVNVGVSF